MILIAVQDKYRRYIFFLIEHLMIYLMMYNLIFNNKKYSLFAFEKFSNFEKKCSKAPSGKFFSVRVAKGL